MSEQHGSILDWQNIHSDNHPILKDNELHLWWLPLTLNSAKKESALQLLSDGQTDKYHRRKAQDLKEAYLAGRYYLLHLLGKYTETSANKVQLSYTELNKPYLSKQQLDLQFNFTDTRINNDYFGVFAFCRRRLVGVDIESLNRKANFTDIAASRFTQAELDYVTRADGQVDDRRCLAIWTRKEAFGKAIGKGINFKMNELNLASPSKFQLNFTSHDEDWRLNQIQLDKDIISCVAHQGHQTLEIKAFKSVNHLP